MNKNNPFEGKAVKFETAEQLEHLAGLAKGYGLEVNNSTVYEDNVCYFRNSMAYNSYSNFSRANVEDTRNEIIHYLHFIMNIEAKKESEQQLDMVNHPLHYTVNGIEVIDVIEGYKLNYRLGNVVKYVLRSDLKGNRLQDLKKALWYLQREIEQSEKQN